MPVARIRAPGTKGLVTGVAPEDAIAQSLVDTWNMRLNQLGRLKTRLGYRVLNSGFESGADQILFMMPSAKVQPANYDLFSVGGAYGAAGFRFRVGSSEIKEEAAGIVASVQGALITSESVPINLVAVNGKGIYKQYYSGVTPRVCKLPLPDGADMTGITPSTILFAGNFNGLSTYEFRIAYYNSVTGEEGPLTILANQLSYSPDGILPIAQVDLADIPVSADADEKDDLYRRIYCRVADPDDEDPWYLIKTIEDNTDTYMELTEAPDASLHNTTIYETAPPTPGRFACMAFFNGYLFVADDRNLYWNIADHICMFDTATDFVRLAGGQPKKFVVTKDRLWIFAQDGIYYIPRWVGVPSGLTLAQIKFDDVLLEPENIDTVVVCKGMVVYLHGNEVRTITNQGIGVLGPDEELRKKLGDWRNLRNFTYYDAIDDRLLLFTLTGANSISFSYYITRDILIYDFKKKVWGKDNHCGLYPVSVTEMLNATGVYDLLVGGAYGVIALIEGNRGQSQISPATYQYDGLASALVTGTATGGSTTTVVDSAAPFTSAHVGCSCVVYRASVDTDNNEKWRYMGVAPIKSRTSTQLTFGHSIGFTVAAGDLYFIGAIPWLVKTPALAPGAHIVKRVEVEHAGAFQNAYIVVPPDPDIETGWLDTANVMQYEIDDSRTGLKRAQTVLEVAADAPQIQLCGYQSRVEIGEIVAEIEKIPEL